MKYIILSVLTNVPYKVIAIIKLECVFVKKDLEV